MFLPRRAVDKADVGSTAGHRFRILQATRPQPTDVFEQGATLDAATSFLIAPLAMAGLTLILASMLAWAAARWQVPDDPRVAAVRRMLPGTNCGGCGFPGCGAFAEAVVAGQAPPSRCGVASDADHQRIARYLGIDARQGMRRVARLACGGGDNVARGHARYVGRQSCAAASLVAGGGKGCFWGCLGLGDCFHACDFDAIRMDDHRLPVVDEARCTACNACVEACPKDLFSLQPADQRLWVACRSELAGDEILEECQVACTACGRCITDSGGTLEMRNNLPVLTDAGCRPDATPTLRCPTGAILWMDPVRGPTRGPAAAPVIRHSPLPQAPT